MHLSTISTLSRWRPNISYLRSDLSFTHVLAVTFCSLHNSCIEHKSTSLLDCSSHNLVKLADEEVRISVYSESLNQEISVYSCVVDDPHVPGVHGAGVQEVDDNLVPRSS